MDDKHFSNLTDDILPDEPDSSANENHLERMQSESDVTNIRKHKIQFPLRIAAVTAAAAVTLTLTLYFMPKTLRAYATTLPTYPAKTSFNDYNANLSSEKPSEAFLTSLKSFSASSASVVLGSGSKSNTLYSPLSLYYSLSLACSGAKGQTRSELLNALSMDSLGEEQMSSQSAILYRSLYKDNEIGQLKIANSLWLGNGASFNKSFLSSAANNYYASSYDVDFTSPLTAKKIGKWISDNTGGKLGGDIKTEPKEVMSLINTVYFYDQWTDEFDSGKTAKDNFHTASSNVTCKFMNKETRGDAIDADGYTETSLVFKNNEYMLFILPKEGVSLKSIIGNKDTLAKALDFDSTVGVAKYCDITFKVPKFSYGASLDLKDTLKKLGVNSAFGDKADFSNISNLSSLSISGVSQASHISIDEKGCEATSYTQINYCGSSQITGHVDMILDRPFIYAIMCNNGTPLFVGVVNDPTKQ